MYVQYLNAYTCDHECEDLLSVQHREKPLENYRVGGYLRSGYLLILTGSVHTTSESVNISWHLHLVRYNTCLSVR